MTRSSPRDWASTLADIHRLNAECRAGGPKALVAFRDLTSRLFCLTVGHRRATVHLDRGERPGHGTVAGGHKGEELIRLTNDHYLRFIVSLYVEDQDDVYLRTNLSVFQYQLDAEGKDWVFRYDYARDPQEKRHPAAHLHVNAEPRVRGVTTPRGFARVHFFTGRPTIESTIRLLIEQFGVRANSPAEVWRPALYENEVAFLDVAHRPLPGITQ